MNEEKVYDVFLEEDYEGQFLLNESQVDVFKWLNKQGYNFKISEVEYTLPRKME